MKPVVAADRRNMFSQVPFTHLLGFRREFAEDGRARLTLEPRAEFGNVIGSVHGGVVLTMLDVAMASAAISQVDFQRTAVTLHMHSDFIAPGHGPLAAEAEVSHHDGRIAWCRARITDGSGKLVAQAHGSFKYVPYPEPQDAA